MRDGSTVFRSKVSTLVLAFLVISSWLLPGCSERKGMPIPNKPPGAELTHGPLEGSWESYTVEFHWRGWDSDGVVDHFLWAIDDTASERAWKLTYLTHGVFRFRSDAKVEADTSVFSGYHTFYLRTVDDDGALSEPSHLSFNSTTFAPYSELEVPDQARNVWGQPVPVGSALKVAWTGTDPDGLVPSPVGYHWRLVQVPTSYALRPSLMKKAVADSSTISTYPWHYIPGDSTIIRLKGLVSNKDVETKLYVFCVKAVDEVGAIEPYYDFGRNVFAFQALPGRAGPNLTVGIEEIAEFQMAPSWGRHLPPPGYGGRVVEVPVGPVMRFYWRGDAEGLAGEVTGYRYALDLDNIDDDNQWSPWSQDRTSVEYAFDQNQAGQHQLYIQAKDNGGGVTFAILDFEVVKFAFDKAVLFVDDYVNPTRYGSSAGIPPPDEVHDAFWRDLLAAAGLVEGTDDGYTMWEGWNYDQPEKRESYVPSLQEITRYRAVIWLTSTYWAQYTAYSKAAAQIAVANVIGSHITGGGRLWLLGRGTIRYSFPKGWMFWKDCVELDETAKDNFAYRFLHLKGTTVCWARGIDTNRFGLHMARSASYPLPDLYLDTLPGGRFAYAAGRFQGLGNVESITEPMQVPNVDTLYYYESMDSLGNPPAGMPCATRWRDPSQKAEAVWFGFPLYFFEKQQAEEVAKIMLRELLAP